MVVSWVVMDEVEAMRDLQSRVRAVLEEGMTEDCLKGIWALVRDEWLSLHPRSKPVIEELNKRPAGFALRALLEAMDEYLADREKAAGYRAEKAKFEQLQKELGEAFGKIRK